MDDAKPLHGITSSGKGVSKSSWDKTWAIIKEEERDGSSSTSSSIKEEVPSLINFGIGNSTAGGSGQTHLIKREEKPALTPAQFDELELQKLIYGYLIHGLPVPIQLVLATWKSVASSFGFSDDRIYKLYPSFVGFGLEGFDYRFMMDPESGRCRRTDGKKWRCNRDVIMDEKYCERHMRRGHYRSRKLVETSETETSCISPPTSNRNSKFLNTNLSILAPISSQLRSPSPNASNRSNNNAAAITTNDIATTATATSGVKKSYKCVAGNEDFFSASSAATHKNSKNKEDLVDEGDGSNHFIVSNTVNRIGNCINNSVITSSYTGLLFSAEGAIQGHCVRRCKSPCFDSRNCWDLELRRCRRTDGKKWRCKNDVIPDQKYCAKHMHRGSKRRAGTSSPTDFTAASPAKINKTYELVDMDMNLSVGNPKNLNIKTKEEKSSSSSTISDTISTATTSGLHSMSHMCSVSP